MSTSGDVSQFMPPGSIVGSRIGPNGTKRESPKTLKEQQDQDKDPLQLQSERQAEYAERRRQNAPAAREATIKGTNSRPVSEEPVSEEPVSEEPDITIIPNFYPRCYGNNDIIENIKKHIPQVDIFILQPKITWDIDGNNIGASFEKFIKNIWNTLAGGLSTLEDNTFGQQKFGFFKAMDYGARPVKIFRKIPIFSSPQIHVNLQKGFKREQSMMEFLKESLTNSAAVKILDIFTKDLFNTSLKDIITGGLDVTQNAFELLGRSPRLGPYFTFKENPLSTNPTFSFSTILVNDEFNDVENNKNFLYSITKDALISADQYSLFPQRWIPSRLFNLALRLGGEESDVFRKYNLCQASVTVNPKGLIRQGGIPDAYEVTMNFKSLMPDIQSMWKGQTFFSDH